MPVFIDNDLANLWISIGLKICDFFYSVLVVVEIAWNEKIKKGKSSPANRTIMTLLYYEYLTTKLRQNDGKYVT